MLQLEGSNASTQNGITFLTEVGERRDAAAENVCFQASMTEYSVTDMGAHSCRALSGRLTANFRSEKRK